MGVDPYLPVSSITSGPLSGACAGALLLLPEHGDFALTVLNPWREPEDNQSLMLGVLNGEHAMNLYEADDLRRNLCVFFSDWLLEVDPTSAQPFQNIVDAVGHAVISGSSAGLILLRRRTSRGYPAAFGIGGERIEPDQFGACTFARWRISSIVDRRRCVLIEHAPAETVGLGSH